MDRDKMSNLINRGPSINTSYQLTDNGHQMMAKVHMAFRPGELKNIIVQTVPWNLYVVSTIPTTSMWYSYLELSPFLGLLLTFINKFVVEHLSPKAGLQNASSGLQLTDSLLFGWE